MELQDYMSVVRKRWRLIVVVCLAVIGLAAAVTLTQTKVYESTTQFFVSTSGGNDSVALLQGNTFTQQRVKSYAQLLTTPRILEPVSEATGVTGDISGDITATTPPDTVIIEVAVRNADPAKARDIAQAISEEFPAAVGQLESPADGKPSPVKVTVVQPPTTPEGPVSPKPTRNLALGAVLGLLLGLAAAVLRELTDTTVKTEEDVAQVTEHPVLGAVAHDDEAPQRPLIVEVDPRSPRAEAFRSIRTNLQFVDAANHPRTIVVTSSIAGEGKSTCSANMALTMAQAGARVCLIEGDLRRPRVLDYLGLEGGVGLTDALIGRVDVFDVIQPYGGTNLWVLGAGPIPPNPSELLGSTGMREALAKLSDRFDYVIIDAPPTLPVTDAAVLATLVDGAIVVAGSGIVHKDQLHRTLAALESVSGRVLGVIVNRVPAGKRGGYARYEYAYDTPEDSATRRERRRISAA